MKLLETVPQDIKVNRNFRPCAPAFYRWIVVGCYGILLLSAILYAGIKVWDVRAQAISKSEKIHLDSINAQIAMVRSQGEQMTRMRAQYNKAQAWLKGNYSMSGILSTIFASLPEQARVRELELKSTNSSRQFSLKIRLFRNGGSLTPGFAPMEDRLQNASFVLTDPGAPSDGSLDLDYSMLITAPNQFFPSLKRTAVDEAIPMNTEPSPEGGTK